MAAIGKFVLWGKENLCLIRPHGDSLALETLFFAEDVRSRAEIEEAVAETEVQPAELELAQQVIGSLVGEFQPEELREPVPRRAARDARGQARRARRSSGRSRCRRRPVVDLMEALRRSVQQVSRSGDEEAAPRARPPPRSRRNGDARAAARASQAAPPTTEPSYGVRPPGWRSTSRPSPASCAWNRVLSILPW